MRLYHLYRALYSLIQFTTITLLYSFASSLGDFQVCYQWDALEECSCLPLVSIYRLIHHYSHRCDKYVPFSGLSSPSDSLLSSGPYSSVPSHSSQRSYCQPHFEEGSIQYYWSNSDNKRCSILGVFLGSVSGLVSLLLGHYWMWNWLKLIRYTPPVPKDPNEDDDKLKAKNFENSVLFLVSCFQYILVAAVFSIGPPYRKPMWTNGSHIILALTTARDLIWIDSTAHDLHWFPDPFQRHRVACPTKGIYVDSRAYGSAVPCSNHSALCSSRQCCALIELWALGSTSCCTSDRVHFSDPSSLADQRGKNL